MLSIWDISLPVHKQIDGIAPMIVCITSYILCYWVYAEFQTNLQNFVYVDFSNQILLVQVD